MKLEFYPEDKLQAEILSTVSRYLDLSEYRVFFFGSRVSGGQTKRSDVDLGVDGPRPVPLEAMATIGADIEELPTLCHIDIVDFGMVDESFREVALQHTEAVS
ncbi:MAG: nucleotidyltransferase domain-containing protein [Chloroflexi bacterium]|nr:nucleotidyltransferase domain-containing protein [Chloroflexota bacterium]